MHFWHCHWLPCMHLAVPENSFVSPYMLKLKAQGCELSPTALKADTGNCDCDDCNLACLMLQGLYCITIDFCDEAQ